MTHDDMITQTESYLLTIFLLNLLTI